MRFSALSTTLLASVLAAALSGCSTTATNNTAATSAVSPSTQSANAPWADIPFIERIDPQYRAGAEAYSHNDFSSAEKVAAFNQQMAANAQFTTIKPQLITVPNAMDGFAIEVAIYRPQQCSKNSESCPVFAYKPQYLNEQNAADGHPLLFVSYSGGFILRTNYYDASHFQMLSNTLQAVVVVPRYRLSDEAPFPAPLIDNYSALTYFMDHAADFEINPQQLILMGESAGGGLTASLALYNRDHHNYPVKAQALIYPMLDYRVGSEFSPYHSEQLGHTAWTVPANVYAWQAHGNANDIAALSGRSELPDGRPVTKPQHFTQELLALANFHQSHQDQGTPDYFGYFSPAYAQDKSQLPPAFISVGDSDLFANEALQYASDLLEAGNTVEMHVVPGVFHVFEYANPEGAQSQRYYNNLFYFLDQRLMAPQGQVWPE